MARAPRVPTVLSIAGSDSGGGAGIQADLKAFAACGVHGMTAITAVTWQNTVAVTGVTPVPPEAIVGQVKAVAEDIGVDAVKIGMLGDEATVDAVVEALDYVGDAPLVLDPVMVAESGALLLDPDARGALIELLLPRATVATPNIPEARALTGIEEGGQDELAKAVHGLGPKTVVVTGGHSETGADVFYDGTDPPWTIGGRQAPPGASHGSGCTHSSTIAALLALGETPREAAFAAKAITAEAVRNGLRDLGAGAGPVDVFGLTKA